MELEVNNLATAHQYNRLLVLTASDLSAEGRQQFITDAHNNNINYLIVENPVQVNHLGLDIELGSVPRYYTISKGNVVGFETGYREGDAIRIMCNFGLKHENWDGGL